MDRTKLHDSLANRIQMTFARSGGAGGQNVNKVNTKVHATIYIEEIGGLTDYERMLVKQRLANDINSEGQLTLDVQDERFQEKNREIALSRMENKIVQATHIAKPRRKTKPTHASKERRLKIKKLRSEIKKNRSTLPL